MKNTLLKIDKKSPLPLVVLFVVMFSALSIVVFDRISRQISHEDGKTQPLVSLHNVDEAASPHAFVRITPEGVRFAYRDSKLRMHLQTVNPKAVVFLHGFTPSVVYKTDCGIDEIKILEATITIPLDGSLLITK